MRSSVDLPDAVLMTARANGATGTRWLRELPGRAAEIEHRWNVTIGATMSGGTAAYVAEAVTADGTPVVVKIAMPTEAEGTAAFDQSIDALQLAQGRGCVALLAHDTELGAVLLERLGRSLDALELPTERQLEIICRTVQHVWTRAPGDSLPTGREKAQWLRDFIATTWQALDRPCSRRAIDRALDYAEERAAAYDPETAVLVHGDAHSWNTLQAGSGTFKLIDPEGLVSEPAHDLAVPMRHFNAELLAGDARRLGLKRADVLSRLTGVDPSSIWQWGFVERVSTGLYVMTLGHHDAQEYLDVADRWAAG